MNVVDGFVDLFEGRTDAYGTEEGGCWRPSPTGFEITWPKVAQHHLSGNGSPYGVYPMVSGGGTMSVMFGLDYTPDWRVRWGCVDFDVKSESKPSGDYESSAEAHVAAINLQNVLDQLGIEGWIERTRSDGRHVWVFASDWTPAADMRRALLVACQVAGVSTREVNPKQESLPEGKLGNYVRLPYPGTLPNYTWLETRTMLDDHGARWPLNAFVRDALTARSAPWDFAEIAKLYVEPERITVTRMANDAIYEGDLVDRMLPFTRDQFEIEMPDDRSSALTRLAGLLVHQRRNPFEPEEILELLYAADDRWGKYVGRSDRDERLAEIVRRAYP